MMTVPGLPALLSRQLPTLLDLRTPKGTTGGLRSLAGPSFSRVAARRSSVVVAVRRSSSSEDSQYYDPITNNYADYFDLAAARTRTVAERPAAETKSLVGGASTTTTGGAATGSTAAGTAPVQRPASATKGLPERYLASLRDWDVRNAARLQALEAARILARNKIAKGPCIQTQSTEDDRACDEKLGVIDPEEYLDTRRFMSTLVRPAVLGRLCRENNLNLSI